MTKRINHLEDNVEKRKIMLLVRISFGKKLKCYVFLGLRTSEKFLIKNRKVALKWKIKFHLKKAE